MKRVAAVLVLFAFSVSAFASAFWVEGSEVRYAGGSAAGLKLDDMGTLDVTQTATMAFATANSKVSIPYDQITSFYYSEEVAHHLGLLPAIAVGLVKARRQKHFLHISYRDPSGGVQTVLLEVSKDAVSALRTTIEARTPKPVKQLPCGCGFSR
jgi:hypothetical protein